MRFDVLQPYAFGGRHTSDRGDLVEHQILGFARTDLQVATTKTHEIRETGVGTNRHARQLRQPDGVAKNRRIAAMEAGRDVRGRDDLHQLAVVPDRIGAERLADVRVQIDAHEEDAPETASITTVEKLYKQKGTAIHGAPLHTGLAPPAFTASCRTQTRAEYI